MSCCHMPCSCMAMLLPPSQPHMSPHASQLHGPCCRPHCSRTCRIAAHLAAAQATSPHALQLHGPHRRTPCSCIGHVAVHLAAAWATLLCALQLHGPHRHAPCSCTPCCCPSCSVGTWAYWLLSVAVELLYLFIIAEIYLLNLIIDCKHDKQFMMNYKVSGK